MYGIFGLSGKRYDFGDDFSYYERSFGGYFAVSYPLSAIRRIESRNIYCKFKTRFNPDAITEGLCHDKLYSYVKDNSIWGPTGPVDGIG